MLFDGLPAYRDISDEACQLYFTDSISMAAIEGNNWYKFDGVRHSKPIEVLRLHCHRRYK